MRMVIERGCVCHDQRREVPEILTNGHARLGMTPVDLPSTSRTRSAAQSAAFQTPGVPALAAALTTQQGCSGHHTRHHYRQIQTAEVPQPDTTDGPLSKRRDGSHRRCFDPWSAAEQWGAARFLDNNQSLGCQGKTFLLLPCGAANRGQPPTWCGARSIGGSPILRGLPAQSII